MLMTLFIDLQLFFKLRLSTVRADLCRVPLLCSCALCEAVC